MWAQSFLNYINIVSNTATWKYNKSFVFSSIWKKFSSVLKILYRIRKKVCYTYLRCGKSKERTMYVLDIKNLQLLIFAIKHNSFFRNILYTRVGSMWMSLQLLTISDYFLCLSTYMSFLQDKSASFSSCGTALLDYYTASQQDENENMKYGCGKKPPHVNLRK